MKREEAAEALGRRASARPESPAQDKRSPKSRAKIGKVSFAGSSISCTVSSLKKSGATLDVLISPLGVPKVFTLVIPSDHIRYGCRILWVKDRRMGISFFQDREF